MKSPDEIAREVCPVPRNPEFSERAIERIATAIRLEREHAMMRLASHLRRDGKPWYDYVVRAEKILGYKPGDIDLEQMARDCGWMYEEGKP